jgi:hypothetical protein
VPSEADTHRGASGAGPPFTHTVVRWCESGPCDDAVDKATGALGAVDPGTATSAPHLPRALPRCMCLSRRSPACRRAPVRNCRPGMRCRWSRARRTPAFRTVRPPPAVRAQGHGWRVRGARPVPNPSGADLDGEPVRDGRRLSRCGISICSAKVETGHVSFMSTLKTSAGFTCSARESSRTKHIFGGCADTYMPRLPGPGRRRLC